MYPCLVVDYEIQGYNGPNPEVVAIRLYTRQVSQAVRHVHGSMCLINADGAKAFHCFTRPYFVGRGWQPRPLLNQAFRNFDILISREDFFSDESRLLRGGTLTIQCDIEVQYKTVPDQSGGLQSAVKFTTGPMNRQGGQVPHDVILRCRGGAFLAHKGVLSAGSSEFERMFRHDWLLENQRRVVDLTHIGVDSMQLVLRYLYYNYMRSLPPHMHDRVFFMACS